jgi:hypothetical protein
MNDKPRISDDLIAWVFVLAVLAAVIWLVVIT